MASETDMEGYENVPEKLVTLSEVNKKVKDYPTIVHVESKVYEVPDAKELPADTDILLNEPKTLQFVLIRILDFDDEQQKKNEKGEEFIKERKKYVGKEYLIPIGYKGTFKLLNKTGRNARYASVDQIIQDLPRFIRIEQEVAYISPGESRTSTIISEGTTFEVKRVSIFKKFRYIKCKSVKTSKLYYFKEDFPINCTAVEDPDDHTFLNIAGKFIPLPKTAQFQNVWADDVVIKDDDEASTMLILTGGPFKILKAFVRRTLYVVRTKTEVSDEQNVGLIPNNIWNKQLVKLKKFQSRADKQEYIIKHFGENFDSSFIISGLYTMSQLETGIIWLKAPFQNKEAEQLVDYINIEKVLTDYENVFVENEDIDKKGEEESDGEDYETPVTPTRDSISAPKPPQTEPPPAPSVPPRIPQREILQLPTIKVKKDDIFQKIKDRAKMGFDKVHEQLLKRYKQKQLETGEYQEKRKVVYSRSKSESGLKLEPKRKSMLSNDPKSLDEETSPVEPSLTRDDIAIRDDKTIQRLSRHYKVNRDRPLPLPPKGEINVTDDDKLVPYDDVDKKDEEFHKYLENVRQEKKPDSKLDTLAAYPDLKKLSQANQSDKDFFSYTVEELVECFKLCGLERLAVECSTNKLDGAFFRNFDIENSEIFSLGKLEIFKLKKIIYEGWRPKSDHN